MRWARALRAIAVGVGAVVLFAGTAVYRFNTLGGAFAGFDNDHFLHFAYAKQVQAGERPLQDFDDPVQGAWPYPTYSITATAQNLFGNSLRTEALVTILGIALAVAMTFVAASLVAPVVIAALSTTLTIVVAPTLYNYPKVLMFSAGALLMTLYARVPSMARLAALALITAIAFVFRHDYAVYLAVGTVAVIAAAAGSWRSGMRHGLLYVAIVAVLLTPSLIYVERHVGLVQHARNSLSLSGSEADRTRLSWPGVTFSDADGRALTPVSFLEVEQNAVAWFYYLILLLPVLLLLLLWRTRSSGAPLGVRPAAIALAVTLMFANPLLLRGNVAVRFGDIGPLYAVVLAATLAIALRRSTSETLGRWSARVIVLAVVVAITIVAASTLGFVGRQLETAGLIDSAIARARTNQVWNELGQLPEAYWSEPSPTPFIKAVQYLNRCTTADDRVFVMPYLPELLPLAGRLFAGGRSSVLPGFLTTEANQRLIVERWRTQSVPIAVVDGNEIYERRYKPAVPILDGYLSQHYVFAGILPLGGDSTVRVFVERARPPVGVFDETGLPCFR